MRIQLLIIVSSLVLSACAQTQRVSAPDVHSADPAVYRVVLDSIASPERGRRPTQLVVIDSTLTVQPQGLELDKMPGVDAASIVDFEKRNNESRSLRYLSSLTISVPIVLVTQKSLQSFLHNGPEPYWSEFYRRYPGSNGSIAFSSIGYSADGNVAVLVVEQGCGSLCGALSNVVAKREGARWHVTAIEIKIVS
jgi:hypothetical protein